MHFYPEGFLPLSRSKNESKEIPLKNMAPRKKISFSEYVQILDNPNLEIETNFTKQNYLNKQISVNEIKPEHTEVNPSAYCVTLPVIYKAAGFYFYEHLRTNEHLRDVLNSFQKILTGAEKKSQLNKSSLNHIVERIKVDLLRNKAGMNTGLLNRYVQAIDVLFKDKIFTDALTRCLNHT